MYDIDLNIENYSINDLERFLKIDGTKKYNEEYVEYSEYKIREQLLQSGHIDKRFKRDVIEFLGKAKQRLIQIKCSHPFLATTIGKDYPLDKLPNTPNPISNNRNRAEEELIKAPPSKNFIYTTQNDFNDGILNPLELRTHTKCLTIDTKYRDNPTTTNSTDFMFKMPDKLNKVVSMQLSSFEIPLNFYNISKKRNNSHIYIEINTATQSYDDLPIQNSNVFIIPDGNYGQQQLIDALNSLICPMNSDETLQNPTSIFSYIRFVLNIDAVSKSGTGKVSLELRGVIGAGTLVDSILSFTIDFRYNADGVYDDINTIYKLGRILGFTQPVYNLDVSFTQLTSIMSENIINIYSVKYLFLAVDEYSNNKSSTYISAFNQSLLDSNILARITVVGSQSYQWIMRTDYNLISEPRRYHGPIDLQRLRIRLIDDMGVQIDLNNSDYSFCLILKQMYE